MDKKTIQKLVLSTLLCVTIFMAGMILPCFVTESILGPLVGMLISIVSIMFIMMKFYPIWFKDYIDEFNRKQEDKRNEISE